VTDSPPSTSSTVPGPGWAEGLPPDVKRRIVREAFGQALRERRTTKALAFVFFSLLVGFTVAGWLGVLVCGGFGGSLWAVVLVLRMGRHLRAGAKAYREGS